MRNHRLILAFICCGLFNLLQAQKVIEKTLLKPHMSLIQIDTDNCYILELENSPGREVIVEATLDGEYKGELLIRAEERGRTLEISAGFRPNFVRPNDKLSAHKVVSVALKIKAPYNSNLRVFGKSCNVSMLGQYGTVSVSLSDGRCTLGHSADNTDVTTQSGNILVNSESATITALSKYGKVYKERIPKGEQQITLTTTTGNIRLQRAQ